MYDTDGRITSLTETIDYLANGAINKVEVSNHYSYTNDGRLTSSYISSGIRLNVTYEYDLLNRVSETEYKSNTSNGFENLNEYTYINSSYDSVSTSGQVTGHVSSVFKGASRVSLNNYSYEYDDRGNITHIVQNGYNVYYHYDDLGQLVREDNELLGETYEYGYDKAGNITIKRVYSYTTTEVTSGGFTSYIRQYTNSAWGDQMTAYDGTDITYDAIGNPLTYYNGSSYTFTWNGRQLATAAKGSNSYTFVYNSDGLRVEKTVNGVVHKYYYSGDQLLAEEWGNNLIIFLYDANGAPVGMKYRTASYASGTFDTYWYERNLQGDIVAIFGDNGTKYATYRYDAWGNHTVTYYNGGATIVPIANNPFRYRGYYYDTDLQLYYLQSRYYDSSTGRFINADGYISTGTGILGYNMYAYCNNNPVMYVDPLGTVTITFSIGADVTFFFIGFSFSVGIAFDGYGNVAIQGSVSAPAYMTEGQMSNFGLIDAGVGFSTQITDDDTVYDLEGVSSYAGVSWGTGVYQAVDLVYSGANVIQDFDNDKQLSGVQYTVGVGIGVDLHHRQTYTFTIIPVVDRRR